MNWFPMLHRPAVEPADERPWTPDEVAALAEAIRHAPSVHNTQPWALRVQGRTATLRVRSTPELVQHDPEGRDRRMSCGAAVANLVIALRGLGWVPEVRWPVDEAGADGEAAVIGTRRQPPCAIERDRWNAISRRVSYRRSFADRPIPHLVRTTMVAAATTQAMWLEGVEEQRAVARLLSYAARVTHDDVRYQHELGIWTAAVADEGLFTGAFADSGVGAVGLVSSRTRLPDEERLAAWLARESVLVFSTLSDSPRDQMQAGEAAERSWLEATRLGLAASVMTQPLRLPEVRAGLREALDLAGVPQLLMRVGYPAAIPVPHTTRRPLPEVFGD
ncbi:hypothetical protein GCM10011581_26800 [Saccharopolyspora subtropica]|uniref:Nitroreductase domain-containing protein n=1 Tax=Saccharopolyspora thermophila TaxID=89367 RepID=A0A917NDW7_9PSEU|nr:nitroreductase family protein [Saccharopolyspora subtropica]GGI88308.1 hypothetical protein GCM10011581_26800 [Saccharopolyspora subtropica]